jgi:hypothetical protein
MVRRNVPLVLSAMNKNGLGAAYTAVLEKLRFPRMSLEVFSHCGVWICDRPTSRACICTCELAMFRPFATTMLAIFRVSSGLNGLGDLENRLVPERGVPVLNKSV